MNEELTLRQGETIVCATTRYAARRLRRAVRYSTCRRLVPRSEPPAPVAYFIVESRFVAALERIAGLVERRHLSPQMFASQEDETVRRKRRAKTPGSSEV